MLEVRDGGSARDTLIKKENYTDFLSRTNYLWVRYYIDVSNKSMGVDAAVNFTFKLNYTQHSKLLFKFLIVALQRKIMSRYAMLWTTCIT